MCGGYVGRSSDLRITKFETFDIRIACLEKAICELGDVPRIYGLYGESRELAEGQIPYWREKLSSLSEFVREIKVGFARYYSRRHNRRGYFWGDRFKSVIVDKGETLVNCLAYIDLHPVK